MSRKEILIILLIICCLFSLHAVAATGDGNSTDHVVLTTDSNVSAYSLPNSDNQLQAGSEEAGTFSDLQNDISNGKLERNYSYSSADSSLAEGITITSDLTIDGEGKVVIDAKNQARVFNIASGATVTLKGITFINGNTSGNGGSISSSGVLNLIDCKFINNTAGGHGGAIYLDHSTSSTIENCQFNDNVAGLNGGAIDWRAGSVNGKVIKSTFTNNTAKRSGGAIHWSGHYGTISASNFTNNKAVGDVITQINGVTGGGDGGAVLWVGSHGIVKDNCNFINNSAKYRGGAIFVHGNSTENCTNTTVTRSHFEDNVAGLNGGAIDWQSGTTNGMLSYSTFINNTAYRSGGAVYWYGTSGTISDCNFTENHAKGTVNEHDQGIVTYPTFGGNGGAVLWTGSIGRAINSTFINNDALHNGGAVYLQSSNENNCTNTLFINCTFESNIAGLNGGAIDWHEGANDGGVYNSKFQYNVANGNGGAIFWSGHNGEIHYSNFTNNTAKGLVTDSYGNTGDGGAVIWSGNNGTVTNCWFVNNSADRRGGAVYLQNSTHENCTNTTFEHVYFINNTAGTNGGAIDWHEGAHEGHVYYAVFEQNTAKRSGGAIYWNGNSGEIKYSNFTRNRALGINNASDAFGVVTYGGDGGAVIWIGSEGTVDNCTFIDNEAAKRGGAVYLQGSSGGYCNDTKFINSRFENNVAGTNGGAIDWNKGAHNGLVENVTFINNTAKRSGGAIFWNGHNGTIKYTGFYDNHALGIANATNVYGEITYGGNGGALMWSGAMGNVLYSNFANNTASKHGGAVYLQGSEDENSENTHFHYTYFINNTAGVDGGAISFEVGVTEGFVDHSIFINNTAERNGGAINFLAGSSGGHIYNSTFDNNTAKRSGGAFYWEGNNGTVRYCNFTNNRAVGTTLEYGMVLTYENIEVVQKTLPAASDSTIGKLYIVDNTTDKNHIHYISYVSEKKGDSYTWTQLDEAHFVNDTAPSPTDWGMDQFFGGNGGTILWGGDIGIIDHCIITGSNSARRGGGAYMRGSNNVTFSNCNFTNDTSGTNGGALDWLAGANYGKVINCTFEDNRAARSAGTIYYDGDYGEFVNITIKNSYANGGALKVSDDGLVHYAGWDSSHWDTNTTGGDAGAIMITGNHVHIYNATFTNCTAVGRGGAIFLQDNDNATFDLCVFEDNTALGTANNTWNDDTDLTSGVNKWHTGHGGAIAFDTGASENKIKNSKFINNTAARDGGAIAVEYGSSNITIYNSTFDNNTAKRSGGAFAWNGDNGNISYSNFTGNAALGEVLDTDYVNLTSLSQVVSQTGRLPFASPSTLNKLYVLVTYDINEEYKVKYELYVTVKTGQNKYGWLKLTETDAPDPSPTDWAIDEYFGGDGGSILWGGDTGIVDHCIFIDSNSARRGGGAYMQGSDHITFSNSYFENDTSGTNGGGLDWLAGANYGKVINCTFNNTEAARSAGAIYYDGDYGEMINITIINTTANGGSLKESKNGRVKYAGWDSSHWDTNTTGGDAGAIMFTGDNVYVYNATIINCSAVGRGGAVFLQDNDNVTFELCIFENNRALGTANNTWEEYTKGRNDANNGTKIDCKLTGHGGAVAFDVGAKDCTIKDSKFINNTGRRDGGAINFAVGAINNTIENTLFVNNTAEDDGGAINWEGNEGRISNITCVDNKGTSQENSSSRGGAICITGNDVLITASNFTSNTVIFTEGAEFEKIDGGAIFVTGNRVNITDSSFSLNNATHFGGTIYIIGNNTLIDNCSFEKSNAINGSVIYIDGHYATIGKSTFTNNIASEDGGAIFVNGDDCNVTDSDFFHNIARDDGGAIMWRGDRGTALNITCYNNTGTSNDGENSSSRGGAICLVGSDVSISKSNFTANTVIYNDGANMSKIDGGALFITGDNVDITDSVFDSNHASHYGGTIYLLGHNGHVLNCTIENTEAINGGGVFIEGDNNTIAAKFKNTNASLSGGSIYVQGYNATIINSSFDNTHAFGSRDNGGGAIYVYGDYTDIVSSNFTYNYANNNHEARGGAIYVNGFKTTIKDSNFTHSRSNLYGGSIYINGTDTSVIGSEFTDCTVNSPDSQGGAIYVNGNHTDIENSTFTQNTAKSRGGAIYVNGEFADIIGSSFEENSVNGSGGAIFVKGNYAIIDGTNFTKNSANVDSNAKGGAIDVSGEHAIIRDSNFIDSTAKFDGGAIYINGNYTTVSGSNFTRSTVQDSNSGGGAIYVNGEHAVIEGSHFVNSTAKLRGGAIYISGDYTAVSNSSFINSSVTTPRTSGVSKSRGGAIYLEGDNCNVTGSSFIDSYSAQDGGAIFSTGSYSTVLDSNFTHNVAEEDGGAIFWHGAGSSTHNTVDGCIFTNNIAKVPGGTVTIDDIQRTTRGGGAIYWSEGGYYGAVKNSKFYNNSVQSKDKADAGAILWDYSYHALIDNCIFSGNYITTTNTGGVWVQGGAMYLRSNGNYTVSNCLFENCSSSKEAGALYLQTGTGYASNIYKSIVVVNTTFKNNFVKSIGSNSNGGGAVQVKQFKQVEFRNVTFINNTANYGGALMTSTSDSNLNLYDCKFIDNKATIDGGAIRAAKAFNIEDSSFINNTAVRNGGAIYSSVTLTNNNLTFEYNKASKGSAIYSTVDLTLNNAVLLKNRANTASFVVNTDKTNGIITIDFKGWDNYLNGIYMDASKTLTVKNVTYWNEDGKVNTGSTSHALTKLPAAATLESGQNFTIDIGGADGIQLNKGKDTFLTDANGHISVNVADILPAGVSLNDCYIDVYLTNEDYYTYVEKFTRVYPNFNASTTNATFHMNGTVSVELPEMAIGNVSVYLYDKFMGNITLNQGKGTIDVSTLINGKYLEVGNHTVVLQYHGDGKFRPMNVSTVLNVTKANTTILFNVTPVGYDFIINVTVVHNETGIVTNPNDVTGNVTLNVRGQNILVTLVNGTGVGRAYNLPVGSIDIIATYNGDKNYYASTNKTNASVKERIRTTIDLQVSAYDIMVDETITINATVVAGDEQVVTGNITIILDNVEYSIELNNSKASFNISGLRAGSKIVTAMFQGDEDLAPSSSIDYFEVHKYPAFVLIDDNDIIYGNDEIINITVPGDANGTVNVLVKGENFSYSHIWQIENGTVTIPLNGLNVGEYNVTASFEDERYEYTVNTSSFKVNKFTPPIVIIADNIIYGNEAVITVFVDGAVGGNVTVKINDDLIIFENETLTNGLATFTAKYLSVGEYTIDVSYSGDEFDNENDARAVFYVEKADPKIEVIVEDIYYGSIEYIYINVNAAGTVLVKVDGTERNITIVEGKVTPVHVLRAAYDGIPLEVFNGKAEERVRGLAVGNYPVDVFYSGNHNYNSGHVEVDFNVMKIDTVLDVYVQDSLVWDTQEIEVTVLDTQSYPIENATGNITLNINGIDYTAEIHNAKAVFHIDDFSVGHKVLWAFYDGDKNLTGNRSMVEFEVHQRTPVVNVTALNVTTLENGKITVKVPANATGYVIVTGNFTDYQIRIDNFNQGIAEIPIAKLTNGTYSVHIKYYGESYDNYTIAESDTTFNVLKANATLDIAVSDITYGKKVNITVSVPEGATGYITIRINNTRNVTLPIVNGKVNWIVENLASGNYTVYANYSGDTNYNLNATDKAFKVNKVNSVLVIDTPQSVDAATNATVIVRINETATGNITITVNGTKYNATIENGVATFTIDKLPSGKYDITAEYIGDGNNTAADVTLIDGLTVTKVDCYQINVTANDTKVGLNTTIVVKVPADATGNVSIYIDGAFVRNVTVNQGIAELNVTMPYGNHTVNVTFTDGKYDLRYASTDYWVFKHESPLEIDVDSIFVGDKAYVNVTAPTDNVTIEIDGKSYDIIKYENGIAYFEVADLEYGNKTVVSIYGGSDKFQRNATTENFTVNKRSTGINITVKDITYGEKVNITVNVTGDAKGFITIRINETRNVTLPIHDGKVTWIVEGLAAENYTVYADYSGDAKYNVNSTEKTFKVNMVISKITIEEATVDAATNATIIVRINETATCNITITVNGTKYNASIENGVATFTINKLPAGKYNITAEYMGDDNNTAVAKTTLIDGLTVTKVDCYQINVTANDTKVGLNTTIVVKVPIDAVGNVSIYIDGAFDYNATIDHGVAKWNVTKPYGNHTVNVTFTDDKYDLRYAVADYWVFKHESPLEIDVDSIFVGDKAYVNVTAPTDNVTIEINGKSYDIIKYENGIAYFEVSGLEHGNKTVTVIYGGGDKFQRNTTTENFTVNKRDSFIMVNASNSTVGSGAFINVTVPSDATGYVVVTVDNTNYTINLTDGKGNVTVYNLRNSTYDVKVTYIGDEKYLPNTNSTILAIDKLTTTFEVNGTNITVGESEFITIESPDNITGPVKVEINDKNYTAFVYEGKGNLTVYNLPAGQYKGTVYFLGNDKFSPAVSVKNNFTINQTTTGIVIVPQNITYGESETVIIYINATGSVNVTVDTYEVTDIEIQDGKVVVDVPGFLTVGNYTVYVDYSGNTNYTSSSAEINFTVAKADPLITLDVENITYGNVEYIIVNVNATGNVTIKVNGSERTIILEEGEGGKDILRTIVNAIEEFNGKATLEVHNLNVGEYPVEVTYNGNDNYNKATVKATFFVTKDNVTVGVDVENIRVDGKEIINVTFNNTNVTGKVIINVDGKNYTRDISQGKASLTLDKLTNATHSVVVIYEGDRNFNGNWTSATFNVSKVKPEISVDVSNRTVGQSERIVVHLPENATGYVVIDVDGTKYHVDIVEGQEIALEIDNLENKTYNVDVVYSGDGYYEDAASSDSFNVSKLKADVTVKADNITLGDVAVINITVTPGATGNVTVTIGDEFTRTVGITDGVISIDVSGLTVGDKTVVVSYSGDEKYLPDGNSTTFSVAKLNSTSNIQIIDNGNGTVTVILPQNATGNVTIYVDGKNFTGNVSEGIAIVTLENVTPGKHDLTAVYSGDGNFTNATVNGTVVIPKLDSPISVDAIDIKVGDVAYINVTAPTDNVTIEINGKSYEPVSFTDGITRFAVENLTFGNKTIAVTYGGNSNYTRNFTTSNFTVNKRNSYVDVNVSDINVGDIAYINVTVPANATGYVIVNVNGTNYTVNITDGVGSLPVKELGNGTYNIIATYLGDSQYLSSVNGTQTFDVNKLQSYINVTISHFGVIGNGSDADITVEVPVDATGKVEITVVKEFESSTYIIYVNEGKGVLHLETPEIGIYNVTAKYLGDDKYLGSENSSELDVYINGKDLFVDTVPTSVDEKESITVWAQGNHTGDNVTVIICDNDGNVILKQNVTFTEYVDILNGTSAKLQVGPLPAGDYTVDGIYVEIDGLKEILHSGNNTFTVSKLISKLGIKEIKNITVGENASIELILNPAVSGDIVSVFVNGIEYNVSTSDLTLTIPNLAAGEYHVRAFYNGNSNYTQSNASAIFIVSKLTPKITVNATNITVGENVLIEITVPEDVKLPVLVDVGGVGYYVNITEGKGQLYVPYLASGNYTVTARYTGDDKYGENQNTTEFKVSKQSSTVNVTVEDITVGDKAVINIKTPEDLCGNVTVSVDGENHTVFVSGGQGTLVIPDLDVGPHTVDVTFDGCKKYEASNNSTTFNVNKVNTIESDIKVIDQGNGTVVVVVPNNATGNVTIKVGDNEYNATVVNGTAVVVLYGIVTPVTHEVEIIYSGDGNHTNSTIIANITAPKYDTPLDVVVGDIDKATAVVTVNVPENATGNVTLRIDGMNYTAEINGGKAVFNVENLTGGPKTFIVEYDGDDNYVANYTVGEFVAVGPKVVVDPVIIDNGNGTVVVVVGDNATGNVTIKIGNETFNATVVNGTAVVNLTNVTPGTHEVEVIYSGDDNHTNSTITTDITVPKHDSSIDIEIGEAKEGEPVVIVVSVPENATGNVTVNVGGKEYNATVEDGKATVVVENLTSGNHTIAVVYHGDENYTASSAVGNMTVEPAKIVPDMKVIDQGNGTVMVVVGGNATGNVTIKVGDKEYNASVVNGTAVVTLDGNVTPGTHEVEVIYFGDDTHESSVSEVNITDPKYESPIDIEIGEITAGENGTIVVKLPENATGNVTVSVDGKIYNATVIDGVAVVEVGNLTAGPKTVIVEYGGDGNYTSDYAVSNFTVEKAKVIPDIKVIDQGNGTVVVVVGDNATGNVTVKIGNETYNATVVNGTAVVDIANATPGVHDVEIIYSGDDNHNGTSLNTTLTVPKLETPIYVELDAINVGDDGIITVNVPDGATGNVTIEIEGVKYSQEIKDGKATFNVTDLSAGTHTIAVGYAGDNNFTRNCTTANIVVSKVEPEITAEVSTQGDKVVINITAPGDVTMPVLVDVDGVGYYVNITDGKGQLIIPDLTGGKHNVTARYPGDDKYTLSGAENKTFSIDNVDSTVSVKADNITYGEKAVIEITVPGDATGNVTVTIDGKPYVANVTGGKAIVIVPDLDAGVHNVDVTYNGDDKYKPSFNSTKLNVAKAETDDIKVIDQGNGTVVVVVGDNATGNVTVKIGNETYNATVVNCTAVVDIGNATPGVHDVEVIYSGDDNHNKTSTDSSVTVPKLDTPISVVANDIKVGDDGIITVNVPDDATGDITIEIDGVKYTSPIENGKATFHIANLTAGTHTIAVDYPGDDNYAGNHTTSSIDVSKSKADMETFINDTDAGDNVTVIVKLPEDATGQVLIDIGGVGYYANVTNGTATAQIPRIPSGNYDVNITYVGDDKYDSSSSKKSFSINKVPSFVIPTAQDIYVGDIEEITVAVPEDATGTVTLVIGGKEYVFDIDNEVLSVPDGEYVYEIAVSKGTGKLTITGLPKGEYTVSARYNGDDKYLPATNTTTFKVMKSDTPIEVLDLGNGTVKVILPQDATGTVTVKIGNETSVANVENGTATITLDKTTPGKHEIEVTYSGDDDHDGKTVKSTVDIPKYGAPISAKCDDVNVGDDAVVVVDVPEGATGNVTVEIDGKTYTGEIKNGKAEIKIPGLSAGNKTAIVKYDGDDSYLGNSTQVQFSVSKVEPTMKVTPKDVSAGKDEVITVDVPKDATGQILVEINGVGYYADIVNGKAKVIIPKLGAGKYTAKVTYVGDDKYSSISTTTTFTVKKMDSGISAIGDEIFVGEDATVTIKLPKDATGTVTITIEGKKYTTEVHNGQAVFVIPGLSEGIYEAVVQYSGDDKYNSSLTVTTVTVHDNGHGNDINNGFSHSISLNDEKGVNLSAYATGNPIWILLLLLLAAISTQIRRFRY